MEAKGTHLGGGLKRMSIALLVAAIAFTLLPASPAAAGTTETGGGGSSQVVDVDRIADQTRDLAQLIVTRNAFPETECEAIFSDQVCAEIRAALILVEEAVGCPGCVIDDVLRLIVQIGDLVVGVVTCILSGECIASAGPQGEAGGALVAASSGKLAGQADPCREVFSDGVCSTIENPVPLVVYLINLVWGLVRCEISPDCAPALV